MPYNILDENNQVVGTVLKPNHRLVLKPGQRLEYVDQQPSAAEIRQAAVQAVQNRLDSVARERNYDSMLSLATYANSEVPRFRQEALLGIQWRDNCWTALYALEASIERGEIIRPQTAQEAITQALEVLPHLEWP